MELVLASGNPKKAAELRALLEPLGARVLTAAEVGGLPEVEEDRDTFAGNARKKAESAAQATGRWCLADDSGLCVEALDGAPGVRSARYAGPECDDEANKAKLLEALAGKPEAERGAHFVCALALAGPGGQTEVEFEGQTHGRILDAPRGQAGFGYDPLFLFTEPGLAETGRAFAELTPAEKARVSHRGRALRGLAEHLAIRADS
jgi:XTP/dITP diphosphohydrolase